MRGEGNNFARQTSAGGFVWYAVARYGLTGNAAHHIGSAVQVSRQFLPRGGRAKKVVYRSGGGNAHYNVRHAVNGNGKDACWVVYAANAHNGHGVARQHGGIGSKVFF